MLPRQHYPSGSAGMTQQGSEGRRGAGRGSPLGPERDFHTASQLKVLSPGYHLQGDAQPLKRAGRCFVTLFHVQAALMSLLLLPLAGQAPCSGVGGPTMSLS